MWCRTSSACGVEGVRVVYDELCVWCVRIRSVSVFVVRELQQHDECTEGHHEVPAVIVLIVFEVNKIQ